LLLALPLARSSASFSSIYVFGDGVSSTTTNLLPVSRPPSPLYFENTNCNGRVWVEVLSRWYGLAYDVSKNISYFGQDSVALLTNVNAPTTTFPDGATAIVFVWCNNADFVLFSGANEPPYSSNNIPQWTAFSQASITRHTQAITALYNKGIRNLVMPNAVNIPATPEYLIPLGDYEFFRDQIIAYNISFENAIKAHIKSLSGLTVYRPDTYGFFEQVRENPAAFGLINPPGMPGTRSSDALASEDDLSLNGPGAQYIFWDYLHPTAKFQMHLAEFFKQLISPVKITNITRPGSNAQITIANVPLGRAGAVQGSDTLAPPWLTDAAVNVPFTVGGSTTTSVTFPAAGTKRFYRVGFPVVWTWP
jgi:phospholipase/lecithinase/hemolysin